MGLLDFFKSHKNEMGKIEVSGSNENKEMKNIYNGSNVNSDDAMLKLNIRKETLSVCLKKKNLTNVVAKVGVSLDKSYSMIRQYNSGHVQEVIERLLPLALKFDDDGVLDMWAFSNGSVRLDQVTEKDFINYIPRSFMKKHECKGGTEYAPVINDIVAKYVTEEPSDIPAYIIFLTDGENCDKAETRKAILNAAEYNIFFQFVGIGDENFKFLKELDNIEGRKIDNANFFEVNSLGDLSDEELYNKLMSEFPIWLREAKKLGMVK